MSPVRYTRNRSQDKGTRQRWTAERVSTLVVPDPGPTFSVVISPAAASGSSSSSSGRPDVELSFSLMYPLTSLSRAVISSALSCLKYLEDFLFHPEGGEHVRIEEEIKMARVYVARGGETYWGTAIGFLAVEINQQIIVYCTNFRVSSMSTPRFDYLEFRRALPAQSTDRCDESPFNFPPFSTSQLVLSTSFVLLHQKPYCFLGSRRPTAVRWAVRDRKG